MAKLGRGKGFSKSETIFSQGDRADGVSYIQKGKVKPAVVNNSGREAVIAILDTGDFPGEECLTGRSVRLSSAVALSECSVLRVERSAVMRLLHDEPAFSEIFVSCLLSRTMRIEADLVDQLFNSSEIGTTRSRVSFFMNKFRKMGLIHYTKAGNGKIEVHSSLLKGRRKVLR
jgi:CRP/FNR family cyclic AMP-dependent transcriptional regulator